MNRKNYRQPEGAGSLNAGKAAEGGEVVFLILFIVLLVIWLLGFTAFHVASGLIHLLLIVAIISLIVHLFQGRRAV